MRQQSHRVINRRLLLELNCVLHQYPDAFLIWTERDLNRIVYRLFPVGFNDYQEEVEGASWTVGLRTAYT
jgi:hypothetical protein